LLDGVQEGRFPIHRETNIKTYISKKAKGWAEDERKKCTQCISSLKEAEMLLLISKVLQIHKSNKTETYWIELKIRIISEKYDLQKRW